MLRRSLDRQEAVPLSSIESSDEQEDSPKRVKQLLRRSLAAVRKVPLLFRVQCINSKPGALLYDYGPVQGPFRSMHILKYSLLILCNFLSRDLKI